VDDWLEDDLGKKPVQRRKKVDCNGFLSSDGTRKRSRSGSLSPIKSQRKKDVLNSSQKKRRIESESESDSNSEMDFGAVSDSEKETMETNVSSCAVQENQLENTSDSSRITSFDDDNVTITNIDSDVDPMFDDVDDFLIVDSQDHIPGSSSHSVSQLCQTKSTFLRGKKSKQKQFKLTDFGLTKETTSQPGTTVSNHNFHSPYLTQPPGATNTSVSHMTNTFQNVPMQPVLAANKPNLGNVLRIKVQVEDTVLMIPVVDPDCSRTFAWLAEEVASRYYQMRGMKLKLSLGKDGAHFAPTDLVSLMLENNDKVG